MRSFLTRIDRPPTPVSVRWAWRAMTAALLPLAPSPPYPKPARLCHKPTPARPLRRCDATRRDFAVYTASAAASAAAAMSLAAATAADEALPSVSQSTTPHPPNGGATPLLVGIANTRSWSQYYGSGFSIRVPPSFDDILEPEVTGLIYSTSLPTLLQIFIAILG